MSRLIDADALKEKYTMVTKRYSGGIMERPAVLLETIDEAPTIEPKQADDLISRADAIKALEKAKERYFDRAVVIARMQDILRAIPSAQPKQGEWVNHEEPCVNGGYWHYVMCTACKELNITPTNFCPNCGADMREREGE